MKMKRWIALILGNVWALPNTVFSAFYLFAMFVAGQIGFGRFTDWAIALTVKPGSFVHRKMESGGWAGWSSGVFIILRNDYSNNQRTIAHEERHVLQQMVFGVFQPIVYFLASIFIFAFMSNRHSYYDNPFERDARKAAGQQVDIPKEVWKGDRWSWW